MRQVLLLSPATTSYCVYRALRHAPHLPPVCARKRAVEHACFQWKRAQGGAHVELEDAFAGAAGVRTLHRLSARVAHTSCDTLCNEHGTWHRSLLPSHAHSRLHLSPLFPDPLPGLTATSRREYYMRTGRGL